VNKNEQARNLMVRTVMGLWVPEYVHEEVEANKKASELEN
jgi:hypothetical protein